MASISHATEDLRSFRGPRTEIIGKTDYDFVTKEMADHFVRHDVIALQKEGPSSNEETLTFGDGHVEIVETIKTPIYDVFHHPYAILGVARDITLRKESEKSMFQINSLLEGMVEERTEKLEILSERLSLATKAANLGTWDWDLKNDTLWWDATLFEIFEIDKLENELLMERWRECIHPDDVGRVRKEMEEAVKYDVVSEIHHRIIRGDGQMRHVQVLATVFRDEEGAATRMVGTCMDVTEKIEFENHLKEAKELAEQASQAKSDFLANMSHEIRTPINAIVGMNYLLGRSDLNEKQQDFINKIRISSEHLLGIVTDILDFSKIEAGKIKLEKIPFNLRHVVNNVYEMHKAEADEKDLEFILKMDMSIPEMLLGDPLRLEQVLNNLLNNALKFTKEGAVRLSVKNPMDRMRVCASVCSQRYRHRTDGRTKGKGVPGFPSSGYVNNEKLRRNGTGFNHLSGPGSTHGR